MFFLHTLSKIRYGLFEAISDLDNFSYLSYSKLESSLCQILPLKAFRNYQQMKLNKVIGCFATIVPEDRIGLTNLLQLLIDTDKALRKNTFYLLLVLGVVLLGCYQSPLENTGYASLVGN